MQSTALYIHWPFCKAKCPYCDFNSHVWEGVDQKQWLDAYMREITYYANRLGKRSISSIFFGGGTPSLMEPEIVAAILEQVRQCWQVEDDIEITLEANPTSSEGAKFKAFQQVGINRLSIGVQALNDNDLKFLGREHSVKEGLLAVEKAAAVFNNYSFDLIYARPQQSLQQWEEELRQALYYSCKHLSLYQLTIEKGTPFYRAFQGQEFQLPEEELAADMYELTGRVLAEHGLQCYEISNYAVSGYESHHNLNYWRYGEYIGIGAGAHGRLHEGGRVVATMHTHVPEQWLEQVQHQGHAIQQEQQLSKKDIQIERLMMGLRLKEGVLSSTVEEVVNTKMLASLKNKGLVWQKNGKLGTTKQGWLLHNKIMHELLL